MTVEASSVARPVVAEDGAEGSKPRLSLVIPAYNEEERLGRTLPGVMDYLDRQPYSYEVVLVDDGSHDGTAAVVERVARGRRGAARVLRNEPNRGKGFSIRRGMLEARGELRLFSDADFSTPIEQVETFLPEVEAGSGVVFGSRDMPDSDLKQPQPLAREVMGRLFNLMVKMLVLPGVHDTQCGFKLFTAEAASTVFARQRLHGYAFDVEVLLLARKLGFAIKEMPVTWVDAPGSKVSLWRGGQAFLDLVRLRLRRI